ncbi:ParA family protein [Sphingobacteriales bacterium UPWRP_1]|nr:chromosome partitioning protein ParA [Sphingobacteriales bacterium TSM_CSS]PSJ77389.1 ParA family protein [Sphingobacteriales bacterium UPWRP_1]
MAKVISFSNHKGGVGKTTSTVSVGVALAKKLGKKVLLLDLDPQANLSQSLRVPPTEYTTYGALIGRYGLVPVNIEGSLFVVPSTLDLSGAEVELSSETGREFILRELIDPISSNYDFILIDTPPSLGLLTINAFAASDSVFIPLQAEYLALQGLAKLTEIIARIQKRLNKKLQLGGVFITQYDHRKLLNREVAETIEAHLGSKVLKTRIRDNVALAEAPSVHRDIFDYNPASNGAKDYFNLAKEILALYSKS